MVSIAIPGFCTLRLAHLVLDFNGTLAARGKLLAGVRPRVARLRRQLRIHVVTADTFGKAADELGAIDCKLQILPQRGQSRAKAAYVRELGASRTACIGNGRNDRQMLRVAALGIATVQQEGAAAAALLAADVVVLDIRDALDLLLQPKRLVATLRS